VTEDSLERDQLNLWEKLNRLYGGQQDAEAAPEEAGAVPARPDQQVNQPADAADKYNQEELAEPVPSEHDPAGERTAEKSVCEDCAYDCVQPPDRFVIANCRIAAGAVEETENQVPRPKLAASKGAMGIEKINETCRRCRRSCKQRTAKLNMMLCLGFLPIEEYEEREN
jgi:hypothetical protein